MSKFSELKIMLKQWAAASSSSHFSSLISWCFLCRPQSLWVHLGVHKATFLQFKFRITLSVTAGCLKEKKNGFTNSGFSRFFKDKLEKVCLRGAVVRLPSALPKRRQRSRIQRDAVKRRRSSQRRGNSNVDFYERWGGKFRKGRKNMTCLEKTKTKTKFL